VSAAVAIGGEEGVRQRLRPAVSAALGAAVADVDGVLLTVTVLHLLSVWVFPYFPTQDGPSHVGNAAVLRRLLGLDGAAPGVTGEYYALNRALAPGWLAHALLAGLMSLVAPATAEKVLVSTYVLLLPFTAQWALGAIRRGAGALAVLILPFVFNYLLHMGFYAFALSLPLAWLAVGVLNRHRQSFGVRPAAVMAAIGLSLYAAHPLTLLSICALIGIAGGWETMLAAVRRRGAAAGEPWHSGWGRVAGPLLALSPAVALAADFARRQSGARAAPPPFGVLLERLVGLEILVSFDARERWPAAALAAVTAALVVHSLLRRARRRSPDQWDGLLLAAGAFVIAYFLSPAAMAGGGWINERLALFAFFAMLLWLGAQEHAPRVVAASRYAGAAAAVGLLALHARSYADLNAYVQEYLSALEVVEPNSTVLPLCFSYGLGADGSVLSEKVAPFLHVTGHIAARKPVVDLNNYEASKNYFPVVFRRRVNPFTQIGIGRYECTPALQPPRVEFLTYPERTGGRVDFVIVWGASDAQRRHPDGAAVFRQLEAGYELVHTSQRWAMLQLYRRRPA
jgi:hypothetical protein